MNTHTFSKKRTISLRTSPGFTIVELLIVVVVIAILAAIVIVGYNGISARAIKSAEESHLKGLITKAEMFNINNGEYPTFAGQIEGARTNDTYVFADTRFCVSSTASNGKVFSRVSNESVTNEGPCGNLAPGYAVAPESCFQFNAATNAITLYYANQGNNAANPACPTEFTIPSTIGGVAVRTTSGTAFAGNNRIKKVALANSMTSIRDGGFDSSSIEYVHIPSSVTSISGGGFGMSKLKTLNIPASVSTIDSGTFRNLDALVSVVIGQDSTNASLPLTISSGNFSIAHLRSAYIGSNVISINPGSFGVTTGESSTLEQVTFQEGDKDLVISSAFNAGAMDSIILPSRVTRIEHGSFTGIASLKKLTIADGSKELTILSSFHQSRLQSVDLPGRTRMIDGGSFSNNNSLVTLILREGSAGLTIIGNAFSYTSLSSVTFPARTVAIESGAFVSTNITAVSLPTATTVSSAFPPGTTITRF